MIHEMRLHHDPFMRIKNGTKTIEIRLNDEKRRLIHIGDIIKFTNRITNETMDTEVIGLYSYSNFAELYRNFSPVSLGYRPDEVADSKDMELYYSQEDQKKHGVLAIEIKLIS